MVAVLDFGSQYTHLITRRIRGLGVKAEIFDHSVDRKTLEKYHIKGIILSGGPSSVYKKNSPRIKKDILELNVPILGICYGCQLLAYILKGLVKSGKTREYGEEIITIKKNYTIFQGLNKKEQVWFSHGDTIKKLPSGFEVLATTKNAPIAAYANLDKNIYGVQFHPEVVHTPKGNKILKNFLFKICHAKKTWKIDDIKNDLIKNLKDEIGDRKVILGVSGGVDSTVAAQLLHRVIEDNLHCVFIDTGLLRKNEGNEVSGFFEKLGFKNYRELP